MKNLTIDSLLKILTVVCYVLIYSVAGYAVVRVVRAPSQIIPPVSEANIQVTQTPKSTSTVTPEARITEVPTTHTSSPTVAPTIDNRCIITVSGSKYNVTDFRNIHSGGDIFVCNSDMTSTFFGQHSQRILEQMVRYRL